MFYIIIVVSLLKVFFFLFVNLQLMYACFQILNLRDSLKIRKCFGFRVLDLEKNMDRATLLKKKSFYTWFIEVFLKQ